MNKRKILNGGKRLQLGQDKMTLRKQLFVVSSELKKQQKNYEASAAHGLRWTRGSRGGSLTGALHSMPAGASSAKKKKPRARRVS